MQFTVTFKPYNRARYTFARCGAHYLVPRARQLCMLVVTHKSWMTVTQMGEKTSDRFLT